MENDIKVVYVQVDEESMKHQDGRHFIFSRETDLMTNILSTFSEASLKFSEWPGLSTYQTYEQQGLLNLCQLTFDRIVFLENTHNICRQFLISVNDYDDEN